MIPSSKSFGFLLMGLYQCLSVFIWGENSEAREFGEKLVSGGEVESRHPETDCRNHIVV